MTTAVYFLELDGLIKIGFTADLRFRQITLGGNYRGAMFGGREIERTLHDEFAAFRRSGEWFDPDPILLATVDRLISERGVSGDACLSLTDPETDPKESLAKREKEIADRVIDSIRVEINRLAKMHGLTKPQAMGLLASKIGETPAFLWGCLYRPPSVISAAVAERVSLYFGSAYDCLSFIKDDDESLMEVAA